MNKKKTGVIYSTNPNFKFEYEDDKTTKIPKEKQNKMTVYYS